MKLIDLPLEERKLAEKIRAQIEEQHALCNIKEEGEVPKEEFEEFLSSQSREILSDFNKHVTWEEFRNFGVRRPPSLDDFTEHYIANGGAKAFREKWNISKGRKKVEKRP
ncbi:MAG: hypothetical protein U1D31_02810 [Patescibacteria group bacterium]|nr:hypothetical protein [bacterium]MDZ4241023.1 hypothetical protein [Patescibacteria group bacterium]